MARLDFDPGQRGGPDRLSGRELGTNPPHELLHTNIRGKDILSVRQFDRSTLDYLFERTDEMRELVRTEGGNDDLKGRVLACLFYEPSTRTSASFISAMERLGGSIIPITQGVQFSSVSKGESLPDTIRTLEQYSDAIVLRHPEQGSARVAADYATVPIINAGDGPGEHPTQALLDLYTMQDELEHKLNGNSGEKFKIAMVGDLRYGRTVHSLVRLLPRYMDSDEFIIYGVSPEILRLPLAIKNEVADSGVDIRETHEIEDVIDRADVVYMTRVQKERFSDLSEYEEVKGSFEVTPDLMRKAKDDMRLMHPFPRAGEIHYAVDNDSRAAYFRQVQNGMYTRMALIHGVLSGD